MQLPIAQSTPRWNVSAAISGGNPKNNLFPVAGKTMPIDFYQRQEQEHTNQNKKNNRNITPKKEEIKIKKLDSKKKIK